MAVDSRFLHPGPEDEEMGFWQGTEITLVSFVRVVKAAGDSAALRRLNSA